MRGVDPNDEFFGKNFLSKTGIKEQEIIKDKRVICFLFGAYWCPSSRSFTPMLSQLYKEHNSKSEPEEQFEVIYVSLDVDKPSFEKAYEEMPWLAIDFEDKKRLEIKERLNISQIPHLVVFKDTREVICMNAWESILIEEDKAICDWFSTVEQHDNEKKEKEAYDE